MFQPPLKPYRNVRKMLIFLSFTVPDGLQQRVTCLILQCPQHRSQWLYSKELYFEVTQPDLSHMLAQLCLKTLQWYLYKCYNINSTIWNSLNWVTWVYILIIL